MISNIKKEILLDLKSKNKLMCKSLQECRSRLMKETHPYHYSNENKMLAKLVFNGKTEKEWAVENNINNNIRKHMSLKQLSHLVFLNTANHQLINNNIEYIVRNNELSTLSEEWLTLWESL